MSVNYRGTIYVYNDAQNNRISAYAVNEGRSPQTFTHNMFRTEKDARTVMGHDDGRYGHGNYVPDGTPEQPQETVIHFPIGVAYANSAGGVVVQEGAWLRLGFRGVAVAISQIPAAGELVEIPYETMYTQHHNWGQPGSPKFNADTFERTELSLPMSLRAQFANREPHLIRGRVRIVPIAKESDPSQLAGWEVWFENTAIGTPNAEQTHGFTPTVCLTNVNGEGEKNAGLGLESMACPGGGYSAKQFIIAGGDYGQEKYGITAQPNTGVRLGIRGHSSFQTQLPHLVHGETVIDLNEFETSEADNQTAWFESEALLEKMGEKKALVDFYRDGVRINDELPDTVYKGQEAFIRAEFKQPPRTVVQKIGHSDEYPGGGWLIKMTSDLPDNDHLGLLGYTATLKLSHEGELLVDEASVPPSSFSPERREFTLFIPDGHKIAGAEVTAGSQLIVDTGALGWQSTVTIPTDNEIFDTGTSEEELQRNWVLVESNYRRAGLYPENEN